MPAQKVRQRGDSTSGIRQYGAGDVLVARLPKTHEDYWKPRLRRRTYFGTDGLRREVSTWQISIGHAGRHRWINLGTANKDAAAKKARDMWLLLKTHGWDAVKPKRDKIVNPNVGQFLDAVRAEADLQPATFEIYARKFRRLVSGVFGVRAGAKHDFAGGGYAKWLARVHAVRFSRITPSAVQRWKTRYIATAASNPIQERRARRTVASVLRSSKALFAPRIINNLQIELPNPLPLANVEVPRVFTSQYVSRITPEILFQQARRELESPTKKTLRAAVLQARAESSPTKRKLSEVAVAKIVADALEREQSDRPLMFRVVCLAMFAGLRRDEIDTLTWRQIDFASHTIRIETNEFTRAKSLGSEDTVDIDPSFSGLLRAWMKSSSSPFVISLDLEARPEVSSYHHYRCARLFSKTCTWLRAHGVDDRNPLHTLRKEFGTQINRTNGLFAASAALRHGSVQLTRAVYVAKKDRAVFAVPFQSKAIDAPQSSPAASVQ